MILALLLAGCGDEGSWMETTDEAPLALGEVVSALWWDWPDAGGASVVLTAQSVSCEALRAFEAQDALGQGPTLPLFFFYDQDDYEGDYLGGVVPSGELWPESATEHRYFWASVAADGEWVDATLQPSVATVSSLTGAMAEGHAEGPWFEANFAAEVCEPGTAEDDACVPAEEVCDGADNDCDGQVDEGVKETRYVDEDGDGHGDPGAPEERCDGTGYAEAGDDCNDGDAAVFPGNEESCNGVDDDCDGQVDEDGC